MSNPYTVCRGGAGTENVHIMQQTEADGILNWFQRKKASPARPAADGAHLWVAPKKSETQTPMQEIHELKQRYNAEVFRLQTKIISLNEAISIKDRAIKRNLEAMMNSRDPKKAKRRNELL